MPTIRTAAEAKAYIIQSIELWEREGTEKRIISLSNWAESWRSRSEISATATKIKLLEINIKEIQRTIARNNMMGYNNDGLLDQWKIMTDNLGELKANFTPPVRRARKPKN